MKGPFVFDGFDDYFAGGLSVQGVLFGAERQHLKSCFKGVQVGQNPRVLVVFSGFDSDFERL